MVKRESKSQVEFNKYLREKRIYCYFELKESKNGVFYFKSIEIDQKKGLPALEKSGLLWKLSDQDMRIKPCDGFCTPPLPAYLVIRFGKTFYMIRIGVIQGLMEAGLIKITLEEAKKVSEKVIHF